MTIRIRPFAFWKVEAHESWFMHMAQKGYALKKMGLFAHFTKIPPQPIRYRIDISTDKKAPQDKVELFEECGWNYVTSYNYFHVFLANDSSVPDLHTDLEEQANGFLALQKKWKPLIITSTILILLWFLVIGLSYLNINRPFSTFMIDNPFNFLPIFYLYLIAFFYSGYRYLKRKYKELKAGVPWVRNYSFKKAFLWETIFQVLIFLLIIFDLVINIMMVQRNSSGKVEDFPEINNYLHLEEFDYSYYSTSWSIIAPLQVDLYQKNKEQSIGMKILKINVPFILEGYLKEQLYEVGEFGFQPLQHNYFDYLYKIKSYENTYIAVKDNIYYELSYSGTELTQKQLLDEMVTTIQLIQSK